MVVVWIQLMVSSVQHPMKVSLCAMYNWRGVLTSRGLIHLGCEELKKGVNIISLARGLMWILNLWFGAV